MNIFNKEEEEYCIQWQSHPQVTIKGICSMLERQKYVDFAISCGNNTLYAHKCILTANSELFSEALDNNPAIEQVIISGTEFVAIKAIIELMYCGQLVVNQKYLKYLPALARMFKLRGFEKIFTDQNEFPYGQENDLPPPQFLAKSPKYPIAYNPVHQSFASNSKAIDPIFAELQMQRRKAKPRPIRSEAEKACVKEANASRMALTKLRKTLGSSPHVTSFLIENPIAEATIESFIPQVDADMNELPQIEVVTCDGLQPEDMFILNRPTTEADLLEFAVPAPQQTSDVAAATIKNIISHDELNIPDNVEIVFKTNDGDVMGVTDEVLHSLAASGTLQYQFVDEHGTISEAHALKFGTEQNGEAHALNETVTTDPIAIQASTSQTELPSQGVELNEDYLFTNQVPYPEYPESFFDTDLLSPGPDTNPENDDMMDLEV